jgi:hypothetical protein
LNLTVIKRQLNGDLIFAFYNLSISNKRKVLEMNTAVRKIGGMALGAAMGVMTLTSPALAGTRTSSFSVQNEQDERCETCSHVDYRYDPNDHYKLGYSIGKNEAIDMAINSYVSRNLGGQLDKVVPSIMKDYHQFQKGVEMGKHCPEGTYEWYKHHSAASEAGQAFRDGFLKSYKVTHPSGADPGQSESNTTFAQGYIDGFSAGMPQGLGKVASDLTKGMKQFNQDILNMKQDAAHYSRESHSFSAWLYGESNFDKQLAREDAALAKSLEQSAKADQAAAAQAQKAAAVIQGTR